MSQYREIKITKDYFTKKEKEFFETFPYHRPLTKYDYTFNKYQKEDLDWLAENACSPKYQQQSIPFQTIKEFIEEYLTEIIYIGCIPRMIAKHFNGQEQTIIKIVISDQTELFKTRGVVLQQMRDYLNDLPYFIPYTKGWDIPNRIYTYKFKIDKYIIDQIKNNPNLDMTISTKNIRLYKMDEQGYTHSLYNVIPIHFGIYQKIELYLKYCSSKTHFCGITTEIFYDQQSNIIYQPYNPELTFEWEKRYDQCQQIQTHLSETFHFGERLKID